MGGSGFRALPSATPLVIRIFMFEMIEDEIPGNLRRIARPLPHEERGYFGLVDGNELLV